MDDDWVVVMQFKSQQKDQKDVKQQPLPQSSSLLSTNMQKLRITPSQSSYNTQPSKMVDEPTTPPSPPSPSPNGNNAIQKALAQLKIPISKVNPSNTELVKECQKAVTFLSSRRGDFGGDLKHVYYALTNFFLLGGISVGGGNNPMDKNKFLSSYFPASTGFLDGVTPGWSLCDGIPSGNIIDARLGRVIVLQHLSIRMSVNWNQDIKGNNGLYDEYMIPFRMIIFKDKMAMASNPINAISGTAINLLDVAGVLMNIPNTSTTAWQGLLAPYNPVTHGTRYEILHDEIINPPGNATAKFDSGAGQWSASAIHAFERHVNVKDIKVTFDDDSTSPTSDFAIVNNVYCMFAIDTTVAGIQPALDFSFDLSFRDTDA